jgi:hypothetical protein
MPKYVKKREEKAKRGRESQKGSKNLRSPLDFKTNRLKVYAGKQKHEGREKKKRECGAVHPVTEIHQLTPTHTHTHTRMLICLFPPLLAMKKKKTLSLCCVLRE